MTRRLLFVFLILFLSKGLLSQIDNPSVDSIKTLLCHKWGFRAIIMSGQELTNFNETITYQFNSDFSLQRVTHKKTEKGTWSYDQAKSLILIKIKKTTLYVQKLKQGDLVISVGDGTSTQNNSLGAATALKIVD